MESCKEVGGTWDDLLVWILDNDGERGGGKGKWGVGGYLSDHHHDRSQYPKMARRCH